MSDMCMQVHFRALHNLPAGEEFTQSYFPLHVSYPLRQQRCRDQYGFACNCPRCKASLTLFKYTSFGLTPNGAMLPFW